MCPLARRGRGEHRTTTGCHRRGAREVVGLGAARNREDHPPIAARSSADPTERATSVPGRSGKPLLAAQQSVTLTRQSGPARWDPRPRPLTGFTGQLRRAVKSPARRRRAAGCVTRGGGGTSSECCRYRPRSPAYSRFVLTRHPSASPIARTHIVRLADVLSALTYALDLTEGQRPGHTLRTALIAMRLGREIGLDAESLGALYYAALLKDAGCSSNAAAATPCLSARHGALLGHGGTTSVLRAALSPTPRRRDATGSPSMASSMIRHRITLCATPCWSTQTKAPRSA